VALSHCLKRVSGTTTGRDKLDMWWRATVGYRKLDGPWPITHEHASVPFDAQSGRASLALQP
jgi:ketosteroid isomerase-like protein